MDDGRPSEKGVQNKPRRQCVFCQHWQSWKKVSQCFRTTFSTLGHILSISFSILIISKLRVVHRPFGRPDDPRSRLFNASKFSTQYGSSGRPSIYWPEISVQINHFSSIGASNTCVGIVNFWSKNQVLQGISKECINLTRNVWWLPLSMKPCSRRGMKQQRPKYTSQTQ